jgi:CIC family chloride channel protein
MVDLSYVPAGAVAAARRAGWVLVCGVVGAVTSVVIWAGEWLTEHLLERVQRAPAAVQAVMPLAGLAVTAFVLGVLGRGITPSTADEYVQSAHGGRLRKRHAPARAIATMATVGSGNAVALEGPAVYFGAVLGEISAGVSPRIPARLRRDLVVAGAASGVGIVIGSPIAGAAFALEVPYRRGLEHHRFLPAMAGAVAGYVTVDRFTEVAPFFRVGPTAPPDLGLVAAAVGLGVASAVIARIYVALVGWAKSAGDRSAVVRLVAAGAVVATVALVGYLVDDGGLTLGPGREAIQWARLQDVGVWAVLAIIGLRLLATPAAVLGGGAGGVFVPLLVLGALLGAAAGQLQPSVFGSWAVAAGAAAVLGAGYRVPLSAATWLVAVESSTGGLVLGLVALVVAEGIMGSASVTPYQRPFLPAPPGGDGR